MSEAIRGYTLLSEWRAGQKGSTAKAEKNGKKYFVKKYTSYVLPTNNGMFDAKTIEKKTTLFNRFVKIRKEVIKRLTPVAGSGGNIIIPCDNFIEGVHYYEVTEFVEGAIPDTEMRDFLLGLPYEEKLLMMKTAAGALSAVHGAGVIHSDLKLKNILIAKNGMGNYVAKIIDFDASYPDDDKDFLGGDDAFASPELIECVSYEAYSDEYYEALKNLTHKTDIFSLGIVFHFFLSGKFPEPASLSPMMQRQKELKERKGQPVVFYPSFVIAQGCEFKFDDSIKSVNLKGMLFDMVNAKPDMRPSALAVVQAIKKTEPKYDTPFAEHNITFDTAKLASDNIVGVSLVPVGKKYQVWYSTGKKLILTKEEMVEKGYARSKAGGSTTTGGGDVSAGYDAPWESDAITFDESVIKYRGYIAVKRKENGGVKGYSMIRANGTASFYTAEQLLILKYAKAGGSTPPPTPPTPPTPDTDSTPTVGDTWPEHNIEIDLEQLRAKGYTSIEKGEKDGKKGYYLVSSNGIKQFSLVNMLVVRKIAKSK
ncbi:MAG: protein kinase [Clostridia bacterium]|nr:protein kinase [Clostridia bacterium]